MLMIGCGLKIVNRMAKYAVGTCALMKDVKSGGDKSVSVTVNAIGGRVSVNPVLVAVFAVRNTVRTFQPETCCGMAETKRLPRFGIVAVNAFRAELPDMRVYMAVSTVASAKARERAGRFVAGNAVGPLVRSLKRHGGKVVKTAGRLPCCR